MILGAGQLAALAAVVREGSFERAARRLHVTPSAISQRVKQLEEQIGAILLVRSSPCAATPLGEAVYRHALQVELLEQELMQTVTPDGAEAAAPPMRMAIAVPADTLATWLVPALQTFSVMANVRVDVVIDDEKLTDQWLRSGRVVGAVTSQGRPLQGCRSEPLGIMPYRATASPRFVRRWLPKGPKRAALVRAPSLAYNRNDDLCDQFIQKTFGEHEFELHAHYLPSPNSYVDASVRGLGWGMNPALLVDALIKRRKLVDLFPGHTLDVPLFWQQWSISSKSIDALASALREHAEGALGRIT